VHTRDDLADLAVDELTEMTGQSEEEAKALIMKAREHWFTMGKSKVREARTKHVDVQYDCRRVRNELKKSPETLLEQLKAAGVPKAAATDALTEPTSKSCWATCRPATARLRPSARRSPW
jgi:transcription termination factor NusA